MSRLVVALVLVAASPALAQPAPEPVDTSAVSFVKAEPNQVMDHALWLTDVHGARLTGSPQLDAAQRWARDRFASWGLTAQLEPWGDFGRGWQIDRFAMSARVSGPDIASQMIPLYAAPKAWSPSTGRIEADLVVLDPNDEAALARLEGSLRGKAVLLMSEPSDVDLGLEPIASRRDDSELLRLANSSLAQPAAARPPDEGALERRRAAQDRRNRLFSAGPAVILEASNTGGHGAIRTMQAQVPVPEGTLGGRARPYLPGVTTVPQMILLDEHANRLRRLIEAGQSVTLDLDFAATFTPPVVEDNVIADIQGSDLAGEVVILGAHLDSWHAGSGATDNAAGSAVVMEAARLLQRYYDETGTRPRRTIRFALWTGEEQGLLGSIGYVNAHYATSEGYGQPVTAITPAQATVSAYYNLDNGSGRIRGVNLQSNPDVGPIFQAWLNAYGDPDARTLTLRNAGGTDHLAFDAAGIPGFQFIQDGLAYGPQTWHTSMDVYDHLAPDDLQQASQIMAVFAHHTAQRDDRLPRKALTLAPADGAGRGLDPDDGHGHDH